MTPPEIPEGWKRLRRDVKTTTDLDLVFQYKPLPEHNVTWLAKVIGARTNEVFFVSSYFDNDEKPDHEYDLYRIIDELQEQLFHEAIWGGWPICPTHETHPLEARINALQQCEWFCPEGGFEPKLVGELEFIQPTPWRGTFSDIQE